MKTAVEAKHPSRPIIAVAPMMGCTDRHFRMLIRQISRFTQLYTEMLTTGAVIHGDRQKLLAHAPEEHPIAIQLGGSNPKALAESAVIAESYGYDEINLNIGCPSKRVQSGEFGACLMKQPELVADCVHLMSNAVSVPVTVKTRIGVDDQDSYERLHYFVDRVAQAGCQTFIIHARKAWLNGLNPRENREVPPLHYSTVYQLKQDLPKLTLIVNGGIQTLAEIDSHLQHVDGVMIGRSGYANPMLFGSIDRNYFFVPNSESTCSSVMQSYLPYIANQLECGVSLRQLTRHLSGLFRGNRGARLWRRYLSEHSGQSVEGVRVVENALKLVG